MPKHPNALQRVPRVLVWDWTTCMVQTVTTRSEAMFMCVDNAQKTGNHTVFIHESGDITEMNVPEHWQEEA